MLTPASGFVWAAHSLGLNASLDVVSFPDVWYRVPYLLLSALQNGALEEVVMIGYLLTRLRQIGLKDHQALATIDSWNHITATEVLQK